MNKSKRISGPALFMYISIGVMLVLAALCFTLYYGGFSDSTITLWVGVTAFTIMYHFWLRIILGNVTKLFKIRHTHPWFKKHRFEDGLFRALRVRKWKDRVLTYDPAAFSLRDHSLEEIADTMSKAETDHWINELISLSTLLFALIWGELWIFLLTAVAAMLFDGQFIVVQRYNRPIVTRLIRRRRKMEKCESVTVVGGM